MKKTLFLSAHLWLALFRVFGEVPLSRAQHFSSCGAAVPTRDNQHSVLIGAVVVGFFFAFAMCTAMSNLCSLRELHLHIAWFPFSGTSSSTSSTSVPVAKCTLSVRLCLSRNHLRSSRAFFTCGLHVRFIMCSYKVLEIHLRARSTFGVLRPVRLIEVHLQFELKILDIKFLPTLLDRCGFGSLRLDSGQRDAVRFALIRQVLPRRSVYLRVCALQRLVFLLCAASGVFRHSDAILSVYICLVSCFVPRDACK